MTPPAIPPAAPPAPPGSRLPLIIAAVSVLACIGLLCVAAIGVIAYTRLTAGSGAAPSANPVSTPTTQVRASAAPTAVVSRATPTRVPTLAPCPTASGPTPPPINVPPPRATGSGPLPPEEDLPTEAPSCVPVVLASPTTRVQGVRTPLPTIAFSGNCPRLPATAVSPSPYVVGITPAQGIQGDAKDPVNPTRQFSPNSVFHVVVAIRDTPANTKFKAAWYATDIGSAGACNSPIDSFELPSEGTRNLDFNLTPNSRWPTGLYRVEIFVSNKLDSVTDFVVR